MATSLKMHSTRVKGSELSINDNRRGFFSPDGSLFIYTDGGDYENASVLWDWSKVPGITSYESDKPLEEYAVSSGTKGLVNNSSFVGSCNDGTSGISTMILDREGMFARKSWIMTPEFVLCIGSDIRDVSGKASLTTSIDQRVQSGELQMLNGKKWSKVDSKRIVNQKGVRLFHDRVGYIVLDSNECEVRVDSRTEDWSNISRGIDPMVESNKMVSMFIRHKAQPASYQYIILPDMSEKEVAKFNLRQIDTLQQCRYTVGL